MSYPRPPHYWIADMLVTAIGYVLGTTVLLISLAFAPVVWLYGRLGGGK
jgi:hypothetical protein